MKTRTFKLPDTFRLTNYKGYITLYDGDQKLMFLGTDADSDVQQVLDALKDEVISDVDKYIRFKKCCEKIDNKDNLSWIGANELCMYCNDHDYDEYGKFYYEGDWHDNLSDHKLLAIEKILGL